MKMIKLLLPVALGLSATVAPTFAAERDEAAIVADVISGAIRPAFAALDDEAKAMQQSVAALCDAPGGKTLSAAQSEFGTLVDSWGRVEMIRMGPLTSENRLERMLFWPDRRGRGLKQVRNIIRTAEPSANDVSTLAQKSVAVQGLLALEFTLFGSGFDVLKSADGAERCAYAGAISQNIANIAGEAQSAWMSDEAGSIATLWQNPSDENPLYRDGREQLSQLFKIIGEGFEITREQRLEPFMGADFESAKYKSALFWRSGNTVNSIRANVEGLEALVKAADLSAALEGADKRIADSLLFELNNAKTALAAADMTPLAITKDEAAYGKLSYLDVVLKSMNSIVREQLSAVFNLTSGFSSLDGD